MRRQEKPFRNGENQSTCLELNEGDCRNNSTNFKCWELVWRRWRHSCNFTWTGKVPENPNIQEISRPREQAKGNSPDSKSLRSSSWAYQAPPRMQRQVLPVQTFHKNQGGRTSAVHRQSVDISVDVQRQVPKELKPVETPQARHDDNFHQFKPCRFQEKCQMSDSAIECH